MHAPGAKAARGEFFGQVLDQRPGDNTDRGSSRATRKRSQDGSNGASHGQREA